MNHREHMKKGECLLSAVLWTAILTLHLFLFFYSGSFSHLNLKSTWYAILLLAVEAICISVHWYRYLAYDKTVLKDE